MSFEKQILNFSQVSAEKAESTRRAIILKLFSSIIDDTPVDTGLLRGNWLTGAKQPKNYQIKTPDKSGSTAKEKIEANLGDFGDTVYFSNNLPYASVAEYGKWKGPSEKVTTDGYSIQAPSGMVRKNVARFNEIFRRIAR
jgi:hypothetical protein